MIDVIEIEPKGASDDEAQIAAALAPVLQKTGKGQRIGLLAVAVQEGDKGSVGQPSRDVVVLPDLHQLQSRVPGQQPLVVLHVVGERRT